MIDRKLMNDMKHDANFSHRQRDAYG